MLKKFIGDREFYRRTLAVTIPIIAQNGITQFVNLLDNIMVGQVGTQAMTGVAIVNQLFYVFNLCIFGAVSGAGIFGAQFFGRSDHDGLRYVFRFKLIIAGIICAIGISSFLAFDDALISLFLRGEGSAEDIAAALGYGKEYLAIMCIGLVPFAAVQVYSGTLRETGQTVVPMKAGIAAVLTNLIGNYILIFGKFGAPRSRRCRRGYRHRRLAVCGIWRYRRVDAQAQGYKQIHRRRVQKPVHPGDLCRRIIVKGTPILANEALWSAGMSVLTQCYSVRGFEVGLRDKHLVDDIEPVRNSDNGARLIHLDNSRPGARHGRYGAGARHRQQADRLFARVQLRLRGAYGVCLAVYRRQRTT